MLKSITLTRGQAVLIWHIVLIALFLLVVLIATILIYKNRAVRLFNTNGLLVFKIDANKKSVMRLSSELSVGSLCLNDPRRGIKTHETIDLSTFLNFFEDKARPIIENYINEKNKTKRLNIFSKLAVEYSPDNETFLLFKKANINIQNKNFLVKFYPSPQDHSFYCTILWNEHAKDIQKHSFAYIKNNDDLLKMNNIYYLSYVMTINQHYCSSSLSNGDIDKIVRYLKISNRTGWIYFKEGILQIIFGTNSLWKLEKMQKKAESEIIKIGNLIKINPYFSSLAAVSFSTFENEKDINLYHKKIKFLLYNLDNEKDGIKYKTWFLNDKSKEEEFTEFDYKTVEFENKNSRSDFIKETYYVYNYADKIATKTKIIKSRITGFNKTDMDFYKNISWYNILYTNLWNNYLIKSETKEDETVILETNDISLKQFIRDNKSKNNIVLLMKPTNKGYNYKIVTQSYLEMQKNNIENIHFGFYIDSFDQKLFNYIKNGRVTHFIIGKNICNNINENSENFLKLHVLINRIKTIKNSKVIFENISKDLESFYIDKLNIEYYYTN